MGDSPCSSALTRARRLYGEKRWVEAFEAFREAGAASPLEPEDLDRLVWAAALVGNDDAFLSALEQLHNCCAGAHADLLAARAAFWLGFHLLSLNETGRAMGWLARARRLVHTAEDTKCVERGYLLLPSVYERLGCGELCDAARVASEAAAIGESCGDPDLIVLARNLEGRALLRQNQIAGGLSLLDEVMVEVTRGACNPLVMGIVYCNVIATCQQMGLLTRAREWTEKLTEWCGDQPQLVTFTGYCRVHRAEVMEASGAWQEADREVQQVCERICTGDPEVLGEAWYRRAEILRLRGRFDDAEKAYRTASGNGRDPQPGLALLRVAQGRLVDGVGAIERVLTGAIQAWQRARVLPAYTEIMLAAGELEKAAEAARDLGAIAEMLPTEVLAASAAHARGAIALARGDAETAAPLLRQAFVAWNRMGAPYIAARIRILLGRAYHQLGDVDGATLEREAARRIFEQLGAVVDLRSLGGDVREPDQPDTRGLSPRELEVLVLVASGETNKEIAQHLGISERTVDRHVSNILCKIDAPTRAAATAFAYKSRLIS